MAVEYYCSHCSEPLTVDESLAGKVYVCTMCGHDTKVPWDAAWNKRLEDLKALQKERHLTSAELEECAVLLTRVGKHAQAEQARQASQRELVRERQRARATADEAVPARALGRPDAPPYPSGPSAASYGERESAPTVPVAPGLPWQEILLGLVLPGPAVFGGLYLVMQPDTEQRRSGWILLGVGGTISVLVVLVLLYLQFG